MAMSHGCKSHSRNFPIFHSWFECNFFNENLTLALWLKLELPLISWFQQKWNWDFHAFFFITVFGCSWFFQYNLIFLHGICHNSTHQVQFELPPTSFPCQHHQTFEVAKRRWVFDWFIFSVVFWLIIIFELRRYTSFMPLATFQPPDWSWSILLHLSIPTTAANSDCQEGISSLLVSLFYIGFFRWSQFFSINKLHNLHTISHSSAPSLILVLQLTHHHHPQFQPIHSHSLYHPAWYHLDASCKYWTQHTITSTSGIRNEQWTGYILYSPCMAQFYSKQLYYKWTTWYIDRSTSQINALLGTWFKIIIRNVWLNLFTVKKFSQSSCSPIYLLQGFLHTWE